jgi:hypothetical protein
MSDGLTFDYKYGVVVRFLNAYHEGKVRVLEDTTSINALGDRIIADIRGTQPLSEYYKGEFTNLLFERILDLRIRGQLEGRY